MLGLFGKRSPQKCPIPESSQKWLEQAFPPLVQHFGEEKIRAKKVLVPHHTDFPIRYDGETSAAWETLEIIAAQTEVHPHLVTLDFYEDEKTDLSTGSPTGSKLYLGSDANTNPVTELPWEKEN